MCRSTDGRAVTPASFVSAVGLAAALFLPLMIAAPAQAQKVVWEQVGSPLQTDLWRSLIGFDTKGGILTIGSGYARPQDDPSSSSMVAAQVAVRRDAAAGAPNWTSTYTPLDSVHTWATIDAFTVDSENNVFAVGTLYSPGPNGGPNEDFLVQKIDSNGRQVWADRYDNEDAVGSLDVVSGLVLDGHGGVIVTGTSSMSFGSEVRRVLTTIRYDSMGKRIWVNHHSDPVIDEEAVGIVPDHTGGVFVIGKAVSGRQSAPLTVRYSSDGGLAWEARPGSSSSTAGPLSAFPIGAVVDKHGCVYVCMNGLDHPKSFTCQKYSHDGGLLWSLEESLPHFRLLAGRMVLDRKGNVVIGSTVYDGRSGYAVTMITADGAKKWTAIQDAAYKEMLVSSDLAVDGKGNTYVTGLGIGADGTANTQTTVKFTATGAILWRFDYGGGRKTMVDLPSIAVGANQTIAITGLTSWWAFGNDGEPKLVTQPATYLLK